jgi:AraC family transcriptional regulator, transcriptional activator of pobA
MKPSQQPESHKSGSIKDNASFEIRTIQWQQKIKEDKNENPHGNNHFEIIWITKGSGQHWIDLQKYEIENNQLFFIKPGQVHRLQPTGEIEGYAISFTESFLSIEDHESDSIYHTSLFQLFADASGSVMTNDAVGEMQDITERMVKEFNSPHTYRTEILKRYFKIFLIYLTNQYKDAYQMVGQTRNMELVQKFMALLEKNFKTEKMVAGYADHLSITPNYLNEIIKKTTGYPAGHHIRQRVVLEAKRQATYSGTCMKEIAYYLGFCDMAHFSKFFKNTTGMNFTEFKKEKLTFAISSPVMNDAVA